MPSKADFESIDKAGDSNGILTMEEWHRFVGCYWDSLQCLLKFRTRIIGVSFVIYLCSLFEILLLLYLHYIKVDHSFLVMLSLLNGVGYNLSLLCVIEEGIHSFFIRNFFLYKKVSLILLENEKISRWETLAG